MKTNNLFLLVFLIVFTNLYSQPYQSFFSSDTTSWYVYECAPDAGGTIVYSSFSDTLIKGKLYYKLYAQWIFSPDDELEFDYYNLFGYVHEDTVSGKYWFIDKEKQKEALFMDLSISKGDTFAGYFTAIVDSVYYKNGQKIIAFDYEHGDCGDAYKLKFIEGVGATNGIYIYDYVFPEGYTLICKFYNDIKTYSIGKERYSDCYEPGGASINYSEFKKTISFYPNPSSGKIFIKIDDFYSDLSYTVYNSLGQIVSEGKLSNYMNELILNEKGLFFIRITNNSFQTTNKLIINGYK